MEQNPLPAIRPLVPSDFDMIMTFFDQMSERTNILFNRNQCNRNGILACFDPEQYGKYAFGVRRNFIATAPTENGEEIAGLVFAWDLDTMTPSIGICVAEHWKGRHLGRRLINHIIQYCFDMGKGGIFLSTNVENMEGQGLYRSSGFHEIGVTKSGELLFFLSRSTTPPVEDGTI